MLALHQIQAENCREFGYDIESLYWRIEDELSSPYSHFCIEKDGFA